MLGRARPASHTVACFVAKPDLVVTTVGLYFVPWRASRQLMVRRTAPLYHDECTGSSVDSRGCLLARDCAAIGAPGKQQLRSSSLCLTALSALSASLFKLLTRGGLGPLCKDSNLAGQPHCDSRSNSVSPRNALSTNNVGSFFARDVRSASVGTARTTWKDQRGHLAH